MNNQRSIIYVSITSIVIFGAFALGYVLRDQLSFGSNTPVNASQNTNSVSPTEEEPWWYGTGKFQNNRYTNAGCNFEATIPDAWYLQEEQYTPGKSEATDPSQLAHCVITFGDDGKYWGLQIGSEKNPKNLSVIEWQSQQMQYDTPFTSREYGKNKGMFMKRYAEDLIEQSHMQQAIIATDGWIHTITYNDKDSGMPRQTKFEELVASVKVYSVDQVSPVALPKSDTRTSVNPTTDLFTSPALGFSMRIPKKWHVRSGKDSTPDVQYSDFARSIESTEKPLYTSSGVAPKFEDLVSTEGSAIDIGRGIYYNSNFSDYLDFAFQKDSYRQKTVTIGEKIRATRIETFGYVTKYNYEYVILHDEYAYTLSVRSNNPDAADISTMLKSFKLL